MAGLGGAAGGAGKKPVAGLGLSGLEVENVKFRVITDIAIHHAPMQHGSAVVTGRMEMEDAQKLFSQNKLEKVFKITGTGGKDNKEKQLLFQGCMTDMQMLAPDKNKTEQTVTLRFADTSILMDLERKSQTFQDTGKKYDDIFKAACKEAKITINKGDKAIGNFTLRLEETDWEFVQRMASRLGQPVCSDITAEKPLVILGKPESANTYQYASSISSMSVAAESFARQEAADKQGENKAKKAVREDYMAAVLEIPSYHYLGDTFMVQKKKYAVAALDLFVRDGQLMTRYSLMPEGSFFMPEEIPLALAGRMMKAQVKKVEKDKVQLHFIEIDKAYDTASKAWFPFATVYSSSDGSGWYVMPEVDDYVRVTFPSANEWEAFASSSLNTAPMEKPRDKSFKAPGGKEILLTEEGVEIICDHQKIFVALDKKKGISIVSSQGINVLADGNISLNAKGKVQIVAKDEIQLQSGSSHVKIKKNQIAMGGSQVLVGE